MINSRVASIELSHKTLFDHPFYPAKVMERCLNFKALSSALMTNVKFFSIMKQTLSLNLY